MQISLRSQLIAGVAMIGASAVAITPITQPDILTTLRSPAIQLASFDNPVEVFAQTLEWTVEDVASLLSSPVAEPVPILRTFAVNQIGNATSLLVSGGALGVGVAASLFNLPFATVTATGQLLNGQTDAAIATLKAALIDPISIEITNVIVPRLTAIFTNTVDHIQALAAVLPNAVLGIINATVNSVKATVNAAIATGQAVIVGIQNLDPQGVWNAAIDGVLGLYGVIDTARATTIGGGPTSISTAVSTAVGDINGAIGGPAAPLPQPAAAQTVTSHKVALVAAATADSSGAGDSSNSSTADTSTSDPGTGTARSGLGGSRRSSTTPHAAAAKAAAKPSAAASARSRG